MSVGFAQLNQRTIIIPGATEEERTRYLRKLENPEDCGLFLADSKFGYIRMHMGNAFKANTLIGDEKLFVTSEEDVRDISRIIRFAIYQGFVSKEMSVSLKDTRFNYLKPLFQNIQDELRKISTSTLYNQEDFLEHINQQLSRLESVVEGKKDCPASLRNSKGKIHISRCGINLLHVVNEAIANLKEYIETCRYNESEGCGYDYDSDGDEIYDDHEKESARKFLENISCIVQTL